MIFICVKTNVREILCDLERASLIDFSPDEGHIFTTCKILGGCTCLQYPSRVVPTALPNTENRSLPYLLTSKFFFQEYQLGAQFWVLVQRNTHLDMF